MAQRNDETGHGYPETWPWPVGKWFLPMIWLVVVLIAMLAWFG